MLGYNMHINRIALVNLVHRVTGVFVPQSLII